MILVSILLALFFLFLTNKCAGVIVWTFILLIIVGFFGLGTFFFYQYAALTGLENPFQNGTKIASPDDVNESMKKYNNDPSTYLWIGIFLGVLGLLCLILTCCFRNTIDLAIAIVKVSARFIEEDISILFVPLFMFIVCLGYFLFWFAAAVYLYSCGTVST